MTAPISFSPTDLSGRRGGLSHILTKISVHF
jgi:hypothetical protein